MAIDFPDSPSDGDPFEVDGVTYVFDATGPGIWRLAPCSGTAAGAKQIDVELGWSASPGYELDLYAFMTVSDVVRNSLDMAGIYHPVVRGGSVSYLIPGWTSEYYSDIQDGSYYSLGLGDGYGIAYPFNDFSADEEDWAGHPPGAILMRVNLDTIPDEIERVWFAVLTWDLNPLSDLYWVEARVIEYPSETLLKTMEDYAATQPTEVGLVLGYIERTGSGWTWTDAVTAISDVSDLESIFAMPDPIFGY